MSVYDETVSTTNTASADSPERRSAAATVWFTGLPSAGKSTLAQALAHRLRAEGHLVEVLDGDDLRTHLTADLGFTRADRDTNVRRVGFVARLLARNGIFALVPVIAPYNAARSAVRAEHAADGVRFVEIHVATPLDVCVQRDVKGLYAKARSGQLRGLTGIDDPYEPPEQPELRLDTAGISIADAVQQVYDALFRGISDGSPTAVPHTQVALAEGER